MYVNIISVFSCMCQTISCVCSQLHYHVEYISEFKYSDLIKPLTIFFIIVILGVFSSNYHYSLSISYFIRQVSPTTNIIHIFVVDYCKKLLLLHIYNVTVICLCYISYKKYDEIIIFIEKLVI